MRASRMQSVRSRRQAESPSLDLSIEHHLSSGLRRSSSKSSAVAARRHSRQGEREREDDASKRGGKRPVGQTEPLVRFDQKAGADRWVWPDRWARAGREREVRGRVFNQNFKSRN
jgi:hypothetical protein